MLSSRRVCSYGCSPLKIILFQLSILSHHHPTILLITSNPILNNRPHAIVLQFCSIFPLFNLTQSFYTGVLHFSFFGILYLNDNASPAFWYFYQNVTVVGAGFCSEKALLNMTFENHRCQKS